MKPETKYHAGLSAEKSVAQKYQKAGYRICAERYRSAGGEIDLIAQRRAEIIFIEVKKSNSHEMAALRVSKKQMARIVASAEVYLATQAFGLDTPARFDVALVDGQGRIKILENAFGA